MTPLSLRITGVGAWLPGRADWSAVAAWLRDGATPAGDVDAKPAANLLAAAERRRAPLVVRMAVEAATQAVTASGIDAATLPAVFASSWGDVTIMDQMCATLARAPAELSPTRFHNSVHNAAAGYWTIATGCHAPSTAVAAFNHTFGAGLLEAALQVAADRAPVLLVASDGVSTGPLAEVIASTVPFAGALVLTPDGATRGPRLGIELGTGRDESWPHHAGAAAIAHANPSARALGLLEGLARGERSTLVVHAAPDCALRLTLEP